MDRFEITVFVAAILLFVSHWLLYRLGIQVGKTSALTWANEIATDILKRTAQ